jgi:hypothetical protein
MRTKCDYNMKIGRAAGRRPPSFFYIAGCCSQPGVENSAATAPSRLPACCDAFVVLPKPPLGPLDFAFEERPILPLLLAVCRFQAFESALCGSELTDIEWSDEIGHPQPMRSLVRRELCRNLATTYMRRR